MWESPNFERITFNFVVTIKGLNLEAIKIHYLLLNDGDVKQVSLYYLGIDKIVDCHVKLPLPVK